MSPPNIRTRKPKRAKSGPEDEETQPPVTREGDVFTWSRGHRALCGNSRQPETYATLMAGRQARLLGADPPFGTSVAAISSRHAEWKEGSGVDEAGMTDFFQQYLAAAVPHLMNGALVYNFIDHKGLHPLLTAFRSNGLVQKNICVWDKLTPGLGGFHMNQSEFIAIAKHGDARHVFNPKLGINSTIWPVAGYAQFRPDRKEALQNHACTKPLGVLLPILLMASKIGEICLDPFLGSGSIMLAAERTQRLCYGVEIEERFVDTTVSRMHALTGEYPIHEESLSHKFIVARTMPQWPHEYILRKDWQDPIPWENVVQFLREFGVNGCFTSKPGARKARRKYWRHAGMRYWTMGDTLPGTTVLNRDRDVPVPYLELEDDEEKAAPTPKKRRSMSDYRAWYKPVLEMAFDDPDQGPPVLRWENHVHVYLPWPGGKVWLEASSNATGRKCEVWLCEGLDRKAVEALLKPMVGEIIRQLPPGSKVSAFKSGQWTVGRERAWASFEGEDEKKAWLAETLNACVNVFTPLLVDLATSPSLDPQA